MKGNNYVKQQKIRLEVNNKCVTSVSAVTHIPFTNRVGGERLQMLPYHVSAL